MAVDPSRLIVALDFPEENQAREVVEALGGLGVSFKVGLELYLAGGNRLVGDLTRRHQVFLDLKLHDIPNTVAGAVRQVGRLGVWMTTLHASGGAKMMRAAREAAAEFERPPLLAAVTVLTSLDDDDLGTLGISGPAGETVSSWASLAGEAGMDGVVCSPREISRVKEVTGGTLKTVTPGIRPAGASADDQSRVATAGGAVRVGGDYLVVGRPITRAPDPEAAARLILEEMGALA